MIAGNLKKMSNSKNGNYWKYSIVLSIILITILTGWVYLATNWSWIKIANDNNEIGDAIGGITNPIIGIGGIILTFIAFYVQYQFNKEQSARIDQETIDRLNDKKNIDTERNFNYLQNEFKQLEAKTFEISKIDVAFSLYASSQHINKNHLNYDLNRLNYILIYFINIIKLTKLKEIENFNIENGYINTYDEIILNNLENLFSVVLYDCITNVQTSLEKIFSNTISVETDQVNYFYKVKKDLESYIGKINDILNTAYPNLGNI